MSPEPQRFFFVHVQKSAGTSLVFRLRREFGRPRIYPPLADKGNVAAVISVDHMLDRWRTDRDSMRVITGHFPLCTVQLLDAAFTTLTLLREPVERTLSYLRHHRTLTPEDAERPLEEIYEDDFRFRGLVHNHMTKMFSLRLDEMTDGVLTPVEFTPEHLRRAKENLERVDVVGDQHDLDGFCAELERRFGWNLGEPEHVNRTKPVEVSDSFRARIAADNAMDVELYDYAQQLIRRRLERMA